ncbi:MAG: NAD(+) synthase [Longimicrobiales bacterium]
MTQNIADLARRVLALDAEATVRRITEFIQAQVGGTFRRRGVVVAISGGVDSAVCAALAVRAFGPRRVFGLMMPERDSDASSLELAKELVEQLGNGYAVEDISPVLEAAGCYRRRDEAVRSVVPEFSAGWGMKVVLPVDRLESDRLNVSQLVVLPPAGEERTVRLPAATYLAIVAATNLKQRVRKMLEYHHADRLHYAVLGTPNRLEYDQGFFVKGGDGLADVKPIAHLYKTQVYQLADHLGIPEAITARPPTTDTYTLTQTQEEFYFSLPTAAMDLLLHARSAGRSVQDTARELGFEPDQVERVFRDIDQKRATTRYLHAGPLLVEPVDLAQEA